MPDDTSCIWAATVLSYNILTGKIFAEINSGIV